MPQRRPNSTLMRAEPEDRDASSTSDGAARTCDASRYLPGDGRSTIPCRAAMAASGVSITSASTACVRHRRSKKSARVAHNAQQKKNTRPLLLWVDGPRTLRSGPRWAMTPTKPSTEFFGIRPEISGVSQNRILSQNFRGIVRVVDAANIP
eukprot:8278663-Pyramimonas_sp.AAC.2